MNCVVHENFSLSLNTVTTSEVPKFYSLVANNTMNICCERAHNVACLCGYMLPREKCRAKSKRERERESKVGERMRKIELH